MNTVKLANKNNVKMVAHRGVSGIEPENTNAAFIAAGNRSYFGVETDVRRTADGQFILLHDDHTERMGIDKLYPEQSTYETLRALKEAGGRNYLFTHRGQSAVEALRGEGLEGYFTDAVIRTLSEQREGLVFLLWGNFARSKRELIDTSRHTVLEAAHPSPLARGAFFGCRHFSKTNQILQSQGRTPIDWTK